MIRNIFLLRIFPNEYCSVKFEHAESTLAEIYSYESFNGPEMRLQLRSAGSHSYCTRVRGEARSDAWATALLRWNICCDISNGAGRLCQLSFSLRFLLTRRTPPTRISIVRFLHCRPTFVGDHTVIQVFGCKPIDSNSCYEYIDLCKHYINR